MLRTQRTPAPVGWSDARCGPRSGIPDDQLKEAAKVPHKWGFLKQMNLTEKDRLDSLQDSVSHTTNEGKGAAAAAPLAHRREATETGPPLTAAQQCRRRREHEKAVLDELVSKATGRCVFPHHSPRPRAGASSASLRRPTLPLTPRSTVQGSYTGEAQGEGCADTRGGQRPGVGHGRAQRPGGSADGVVYI